MPKADKKKTTTTRTSPSRAAPKPKQRHNFSVKPKTPGQTSYIRSIEQNVVTLCSGFAGTGKAAPLDSLVITPGGPVRMGDIKIGDIVVTPNGGRANVVGVFPQGPLEIFKMTFSDGTSTECCANHLWLTKTDEERTRGWEGSVRTTAEVKETLKVKRDGRKNHSIPMTRPVDFDAQELPIAPYLLGVLLGDGSLGYSISLSTADDFIFEQVQIHCRPIGIEIKKKKDSAYDYYLTKVGKKNPKPNPLKEILRDLDLVGTKSYTKFVPTLYKYASIEQRLACLRGLMDTDGTIRNGHISFTSTSETLALDVKFLAESMGAKATMANRITSYTYKGKKRQGRVSYRVSMSFPPDINPFLLPRKAEKYVPRTKYQPTRYVTSIESIEEKEAQCILLDDEDHLYLTNNFIVTHNTLLAIGKAMELWQKSKGTESEFAKVVVVRPAVEACGETIGFLPGGINEKMRPLIQPVIDNLRFFIRDEAYLNALLEPGNGTAPVIEVIPLAYLRGRTFNNCIVVFDEAQNSSVQQMKLFLTRIGENSKVIIEGDITQSDKFRERDKNGLADAMGRLDGVPDVGIVILGTKDIQRSKIIAPILERYEDIDGI